MILRDAVSSLRGMFKLVSSDDVISDRLCAAELKNAAIKLIKQQIDKRRLFSSDNIFTTIPCLEMIQVPLAECCSYTSPCTIARSKVQIPKMGDSIYGPIVQKVSSIDGMVEFKYSDANRYVNYLQLYPEGKQKFFWKNNGYLYISDPNIETIKLIAFFEEDVPLDMLACGETLDCIPNPLDSDFKCPSYLMEDVLNIARDVILKTYKRSEQDNTENDKSEAK